MPFPVAFATTLYFIFRTSGQEALGLTFAMQSGVPIRVVNVERLGDGIVVEFDDGRFYVYPTDLLLFMTIYARQVPERDLGEFTAGES
jgi:hypothetical protein